MNLFIIRNSFSSHEKSATISASLSPLFKKNNCNTLNIQLILTVLSKMFQLIHAIYNVLI